MLKMIVRTETGKKRNWDSPSYKREVGPTQFVFRGDVQEKLSLYGGGNPEATPRNRRSARHYANPKGVQVPGGKTAAHHVPRFSKAGIQRKFAQMVLYACVAMAAMGLLVKYTHLTALQEKTVVMLQRQRELTALNGDLSKELMEWAKRPQIGYDAVKLGMVDSNGVKPILIQLP